MSSYQNEQLEALWMVRRYLKNLSAAHLQGLKCEAADYLDFRQWEELQERRKRFSWPDKPILFDDLEKKFIEIGIKSALMYLHNSPGLLRIKKQWQQINRSESS